MLAAVVLRTVKLSSFAPSWLEACRRSTGRLCRAIRAAATRVSDDALRRPGFGGSPLEPRPCRSDCRYRRIGTIGKMQIMIWSEGLSGADLRADPRTSRAAPARQAGTFGIVSRGGRYGGRSFAAPLPASGSRRRKSVPRDHLRGCRCAEVATAAATRVTARLRSSDWRRFLAYTAANSRRQAVGTHYRAIVMTWFVHALGFSITSSGQVGQHLRATSAALSSFGTVRGAHN